MNRKVATGGAAGRNARRTRTIVAPPPRAVAIEDEPAGMREPERPFEEGVRDAIDADLRHRLISETAYAMYARRGYADGFDVEDWLAAEAEVDHLLISPVEEGRKEEADRID